MQRTLTTRNRHFIILLLIALIASSCCSTVEKRIKENDKQIPIGFGKEDTYLLVLQKNRRYNKWLDKRFPENYFGKYEVIAPDQISDSKYADKDKYRYTFDFEYGADPDFYRMVATGTMVSFVLFDRVTGKFYKSAFAGQDVSDYMKDYLIRLEQIRKKNSGQQLSLSSQNTGK
jgi:hypothetical protein